MAFTTAASRKKFAPAVRSGVTPPHIPPANFAAAVHRRKPPPLPPYGERQPNTVGVGKSNPPGINPNAYGPRQPDLVGVGATAPGAPAAAPSQTQQVAASAQANMSALDAYVASITDPQERAYVEAQLAPQYAAYQAQLAAAQQQYAAEQQAVQGFTKALIDQIGGIVSGMATPYGQIAASQVAAGKAAGESLAAANPNSKTQAILSAIGAPSSQAADLEKLGRDVFTGGGAVLTGTGGTLPSFQTAGQGVGVLGFAAAQPAIAGAYGQESLRQLLAQEAQQRSALDAQWQQTVAGIPKYQSDYQSQQAATQKAAEDRAMTPLQRGDPDATRTRQKS